jgi:F-type H+-transporting ATPase subunit b
MVGTLLAAGGGTFTDVNLATVIWAWVSFLVTLFALKKVAWPMLAAKMEEREVRIAEGLKKAEEAEKRAQELMTKQEQILDEARNEAGKLIAAEGGLTDLNWATVLWAWVAFAVTLFALKKVAWPMLAAKMEEREVRIAEGLKKAEEAEKRAQELMTKQEQILDEARKEAQKFVADARVAAENAKNDALASAQKEIEAQRERAKKEIGLERAHAVEELKKAAVELTLEASARLLKREMRDEDHRRLAREVIDEVVAKR